MGQLNTREERMADDEDSRSGSNYSDMSLSTSSESEESDAPPDHNFVQMLLQSLISSGEVMLQSVSEDECSLFNRRIPKMVFKPNTKVLDKSEFAFFTKQATGELPEPKAKIPKVNNLASILLNREIGCSNRDGLSQVTKRKITNRYLPNEMDDSAFENSSGKIFCGIFSKDGNRFLTAAQDRFIRVYDSSDGSYKPIKTLKARDVGWSIIDVAFSPDKEHFIYSTWSSSLHMCTVNGSTDHQEPLSLLNTGRRFCVFSVVFSSDGQELLGGANDGCLYIYDLERNHRTLKIPAHEYDVNSVKFADDSSHIIYSGGDDGLIKVWDRRTLDERSPKPVGVLAGHIDGITYIDSRGDGRHLISNSKDQSIKLWDVRLFSGKEAAERSLKAVNDQTWDYRWQEVPRKLYSSKSKLEGDTSVMTYKGHVVIKTLVRCRFSPLETTGQRYIYTGCGLGRIVVYDALTGKVVKHNNGHVACVRDVSWHPTRNEILSSSWDGVVGKWTYRDLDTLYADKKAEAQESRRNSTRSNSGSSAAQPVRRSERLAHKRRNLASTVWPS